MAAPLSPTRALMKRRLSVDAEDELFKSLQGVQELNNSQRQSRTVMGSPGNHSGRMNRRSIDVTRTSSPGKHSSRRGGGEHSGRRERKSIDVSKGGASPGSYAARRQRRHSINNSGGVSPKRNNSSGVSPKRNNSGRRSARSPIPNNNNNNKGSAVSPPPVHLERQASGGTVRKANRMRRRGSTGVMDSPGTLSPKGRTSRRSTPNVKGVGNPSEAPVTAKEKGRTKQRSQSPKPSGAATGASPAVIRSFHRRRVMSTSPTSSPTSPKATTNSNNNNNNNVYSTTQTTPTKSPKDTKLWKEMTMRANLIKNAKPPKLDNSTTSWASFDDDNNTNNLIKNPKPPKLLDNSTTSWASFDDDIIGSDVEKEETVSDSEQTDATKPISERTAQSDRSGENRDLKNLLEQLKDPAEMERRRLERERQNIKAYSTQTQTLVNHHDKVAEQSSSRNLKNFLQRSKRGYGQQANLDGLSVMQ